MELKNNKISPIFIIGAPRSGTTLLRSMLSSHREVTIPHEYALVENVINNFSGSKISKEEILKFVDSQYKLLHFKDWNIDRDVLIQSFSKTQFTKAEIIDLFYRIYLSTHTPSKTIWGDKNINTLSYINEIIDLFPDARFIHIVRDGRDVAASLQSRVWKFYTFRNNVNFYINHCKGSIQTWITALNEIDKSFRASSSQLVLKIYYEALINDPELILRNICAHLSIDFDADMLLYYENEKSQKTISEKRLKGTHENILKPIIKNDKKKFLSFFSTNDLKYIESLAAVQLKKNGYNLETNINEISKASKLKMNVTYRAGYIFQTIIYKMKQSLKRILK